ncbi:MAG: pilus assembly protein CpaF, partial [Magnetospirillum sp.]
MIHRVTIDAFALSPETAQVLKEVRDDRAFAKSRFSVMAGGLAGAAAYYADKPSPQVVVVEEEDDDAVMLARLGQLADVCAPGTRVVVIGTLNDITLYRTLLGHGV